MPYAAISDFIPVTSTWDAQKKDECYSLLAHVRANCDCVSLLSGGGAREGREGRGYVAMLPRWELAWEAGHLHFSPCAEHLRHTEQMTTFNSSTYAMVKVGRSEATSNPIEPCHFRVPQPYNIHPFSIIPSARRRRNSEVATTCGHHG